MHDGKCDCGRSQNIMQLGSTIGFGHVPQNGGCFLPSLPPAGRDPFRLLHKLMNNTETSALVAFLESSIQCFANNGSSLTGAALVAAVDHDLIDPEVTSAYLKLLALGAQQAA